MDQEKLTLPSNASIFTRTRLAIQAMQILKDDPGNTYYGPLVNVCMDTETYAEIARKWRQTSEGRRLLDERPTLQGRELDLDALARLPEGTLGHEFVRYFRKNGIEPFETTFEIKNDVDYLSKRYRETHDLFHVLTGYGTDVTGEMELQSFVLGNLGLRQSMLILLFTVPLQIKELGVKNMPDYLDRIRAAYWRGRRSREMLSVRYEKLWEQPVSALSELLCAAT